MVDFKWRGTRKRRGVRGSDEEEEGRKGWEDPISDRQETEKNRRNVRRRKRIFKR